MKLSRMRDDASTLLVGVIVLLLTLSVGGDFLHRLKIGWMIAALACISTVFWCAYLHQLSQKYRSFAEISRNLEGYWRGRLRIDEEILSDPFLDGDDREFFERRQREHLEERLFHSRMAAKYQRAARRPWFGAEPDPPSPLQEKWWIEGIG